jgi:hypothetical protein
LEAYEWDFDKTKPKGMVTAAAFAFAVPDGFILPKLTRLASHDGHNEVLEWQ